MRTIKFRGKVLHRKSHQKNEWVYGMPTIFRDGRTAIRWQCSEKAKDPEAWKTQSVEPETLGQFTGAYDRNGKEILSLLNRQASTKNALSFMPNILVTSSSTLKLDRGIYMAN